VALNPALLHELEMLGMTNAALEQLALLLRMRVYGSITWHCVEGELVKFEIRQSGSLRNRREMNQAMAGIQP
jgi:hypothetical protein